MAMDARIILGDCLKELDQFPDNTFTGVITDPPYGINFMGKEWDHGVPGMEFWKEILRVCKPGAFLLAFGGTRTFHRLTCAIEDSGWEIRDCMMWLYGSGFPKSLNIGKGDERAKRFAGCGTALKPSWEPIIVAMKPTDGTFVNNALTWEIAGLNIDGCRIPTDPKVDDMSRVVHRQQRQSETWEKGSGFKNETNNRIGVLPEGRWPANTILDEEAAEMLDEQIGDIGGTSRFFYCAKASRSERGEYNNHPTVKPLKLMRYLVRLVKPPTGGLVLDPFAGSGTTALACIKEGVASVSIEIDEENFAIMSKRIEQAKEKNNLPPLISYISQKG